WIVTIGRGCAGALTVVKHSSERNGQDCRAQSPIPGSLSALFQDVTTGIGVEWLARMKSAGRNISFALGKRSASVATLCSPTAAFVTRVDVDHRPIGASNAAAVKTPVILLMLWLPPSTIVRLFSSQTGLHDDRREL